MSKWFSCCCVGFYGPSTLFMSFRARSFNLSTMSLGKSRRPGFFFFFFFKMISLILSRGGVKTGYPREKTTDHPQAELGLSHMWPELGSNPQRWDDEWFRALKISGLNHSGHLLGSLRVHVHCTSYTFFHQWLTTVLLGSAEGREWLQKLFHDHSKRQAADLNLIYPEWGVMG